MVVPIPIITGLMMASLALWVWAFVRTNRFIIEHKEAGQSLLHPGDGISLWMRFLTPRGFGEEAEPRRRSIIRMYLLALVPFLVAAIAMMWLPPVPA